MGKSSATNQLVKECLYTSLMLLMEQKEFQNITITDIAKKAGVSRMAYYRNYETKEAILEERAEKAFQEFKCMIEGEPELTERSFFRQLFQTMKENQLLFRNMIKANMEDIMRKHAIEYGFDLFQMRFSIKGNETEIKYIMSFLVGGTMNLMKTWADNGYRESVEEMTEIACWMAGYKEIE